MRIKLKGSPEDLIKRCEPCDYCIFEDILSEEQRKIKVLDYPIPKNHPHRLTIEQICGRNYDEVCPMKYAAMRSLYDDFMAAQFGAVKDFIWDLGKKKNSKVEYEEALKEWLKIQDLGRNLNESYAKRFREIWDKGDRKGKQILNVDYIYEVVIANPKTYEKALNLLDDLIKEHKERDAK